MVRFNKYAIIIKQYLKHNSVLVALVLIVLAVVSVSIYKLFSEAEEDIYVRVKVSQGFWWASTLKPSIWLVDSLQKGDVERSLTGKKIAEILEVRSYPIGYAVNGSDQYDSYLLVHLRVSKNKQSNQYIFKREPILAGGPIDFEFEDTIISGTVMRFSTKRPNDNYIEKVVTIQKKDAQMWEYDAINENETFFDGEDIVIQVVSKEVSDYFSVYNSVGNNYPILSNPTVNIKATLKIKLKEKGNIYREEVPLKLGKPITLPLNNFVFTDFIVTSIQ